ncbi:MAG: hypothetical protein NT154_31010 [Verrucomicrobia bacterium]|nr:hypothetical protein [Verrucomicrobiota bacterium]
MNWDTTRNNAALAHFVRCASVLLAMLAAAGCGRSKVESAVSTTAGVSWYSLLEEAGDFSSLARRIGPGTKAKMFSSAKDSSKVMLAHLALEIIGDMDYGFFTEVTTNKGGVSATLAEFTGPGVVTWVWSANPVGTLKLYVDNADQPALSMPFSQFLKGGFLILSGSLAVTAGAGDASALRRCRD